jgi:hypothetical protein
MSLLLSRKKHQRSYRRTKRAKKKFLLELYRQNYFVCISTSKSLTANTSVIVTWAVNISELSVKYRWIESVGIINGKSPME